jgi:hypothetical protein
MVAQTQNARDYLDQIFVSDTPTATDTYRCALGGRRRAGL